MPDLDTVAFWCCESVLHDTQEVESSQGPIKVRWERAPHGYPFSMWWRCMWGGSGCWPWIRHRKCKHTEQAERQHCGWDTGPGIGDVGKPLITNREPLIRVCPRCGGPVTAQRWGV